MLFQFPRFLKSWTPPTFGTILVVPVVLLPVVLLPLVPLVPVVPLLLVPLVPLLLVPLLLVPVVVESSSSGTSCGITMMTTGLQGVGGADGGDEGGGEEGGSAGVTSGSGTRECRTETNLINPITFLADLKPPSQQHTLCLLPDPWPDPAAHYPPCRHVYINVTTLYVLYHS